MFCDDDVTEVNIVVIIGLNGHLRLRSKLYTKACGAYAKVVLKVTRKIRRPLKTTIYVEENREVTILRRSEDGCLSFTTAYSSGLFGLVASLTTRVADGLVSLPQKPVWGRRVFTSQTSI